MRISPLILKDYFTVHLSFSAMPEFEMEEGPTRIDVSDLEVDVQEFKNQEDERKRALQISLNVKEAATGKYPYEFGISLVGYFEVSEFWPSEHVNTLLNSNGPALLYSAARHALATATGTGPYPKLVLPSVTFVETPKESVTDPKTLTKASKPKPSRRRKQLSDTTPDSGERK